MLPCCNVNGFTKHVSIKTLLFSVRLGAVLDGTWFFQFAGVFKPSPLQVMVNQLQRYSAASSCGYPWLVRHFRWARRRSNLGGGFKHVLFSPLFGEMIQFDLRIFFRWVGKNHQLVITAGNVIQENFLALTTPRTEWRWRSRLMEGDRLMECQWVNSWLRWLGVAGSSRGSCVVLGHFLSARGYSSM